MSCCSRQTFLNIVSYVLCTMCLAFLINSYLLFLSAFAEVDPIDNQLAKLGIIGDAPPLNCTMVGFANTNSRCRAEFFCATSPLELSAAHVFERVESLDPLCHDVSNLTWTRPMSDVNVTVVNVTSNGWSDLYFFWDRGEIDLAVGVFESQRRAAIVRWAVPCAIVLFVICVLCVILYSMRVRSHSSQLAGVIFVCGRCTPRWLVRRLMAKPTTNINANGANGMTALHIAVDRGSVRAVEALLENADIDVNRRCFGRKTALHMAALLGREKIIKRLTAAPVNPDSLDVLCLTPLGYAAREGNIKCLLALLDGGAACDVAGERFCPLYLAVHNKQRACIRALLAHGASPQKALLQAVVYSDTAVIEAMLDNGVDVYAHDTNHSTPLFLAANVGSLKHVKLLMERGVEHRATIDGRVPLHAAAACGFAAVVAHLLEQGVDVNMTDHFGNTAAHVIGTARNVSASNCVAVLKVLLNAGADVNVSNTLGMTAFFNMVKHGHVDGVRLLIDAGADCSVLYSGTSALASAAEDGRADMVRLLAERADVDSDGTQALRAAVTKARTKVVQFLLALGEVPSQMLIDVAETLMPNAVAQDRAAVMLLLQAMKDEPNRVAMTRANMADDMADALSEDDPDGGVQMRAVPSPVDESAALLVETRRTVLRLRAEWVRDRIFAICVGLHALRRLSALELLTIVDASVDLARYVPMHVKWQMICVIRQFKN